MGYVRVEVLIAPPDGGEPKRVIMLADTGSFHTALPVKLAEEIGIKPLAHTRMLVADGRTVEVGVSLAYLKILDREGVFQVVILDVPEPLLGVSTLEGLGLKVDPVTGKVEHSRPYGLAILSGW